MGKKKGSGNRPIELALVTAILTLVTQLLSLIEKLIEWLAKY